MKNCVINKNKNIKDNKMSKQQNAVIKVIMAHNITHTCLRELPREYGENADILLRLIDTELKA
jgi:hypothetical protein